MKILIIQYKPHNTLGGVETYTKNLINVFLGQNHSIIELCFFDGAKNTLEKRIKNQNLKTIILDDKNFLENKGGNFFKKSYHKVKGVIKKYNPDIIINNTVNYYSTKEAFKNNTIHINVQHQSLSTYSWWHFGSLNRIINSIFGLSYYKANIHANNVVLFIKNAKKRHKNHIAINLAMEKRFIFEKRKEAGGFILWAGRFYEPVKGIKYLNHIYDESTHKNNFLLLGRGKDKNKILIPKNKIKYQNRENLLKTLKKTKIFILTSKSEGFPNVVVEALSTGTPVVMFDSFETAVFFNDCPGVFLVKKYNIEEFNEKINTIMLMDEEKWKELSNKIVDWSKKIFHFSVFSSKWISLIETIENNKRKKNEK